MTDDTAGGEGAGGQSFREFVEANQRWVYYLALDLHGNHHDAEDLSQEVFIRAHTGLESFRGDASVRTWLRRIAINLFLNSRRKKAVRFMSFFENDEDQAVASVAHLPDSSAEAAEIRRNVDEALKRLSPAERSAFVLRHLQDLTVSEVAVTMEVADGTVKSLLHRATRKMQKALAVYSTTASRTTVN
ncbi:MAG: RNA polymerase sigma factor [Rhodothermales bacterium]